MSSDNKNAQTVVTFPIVRITRDDIKDLVEDIRRSIKIRLPQMAEEGSELIEDAIELVIRAVIAPSNMLEIIVPMQQIMGTIWMLLSRVTDALMAVAENASNSVVTAVALKKEGEDAAKIFEDADRTVKVAPPGLELPRVPPPKGLRPGAPVPVAEVLPEGDVEGVVLKPPGVGVNEPVVVPSSPEPREGGPQQPPLVLVGGLIVSP